MQHSSKNLLNPFPVGISSNNYMPFMNYLRILPEPTFALDIHQTSDIAFSYPQEMLKKHKKVIELSVSNNLPIKFLGYAPTFTNIRIYKQKESDWVFMNLSKDPFYIANRKRLLVPRQVANDIKGLVKKGIDFDAIYIAHEIPKGVVKNGESIPLELMTPILPSEVMTRLLKPEIFWRSLGQLFFAFTSAMTTSVATGLDPVLFGVNINPNKNNNTNSMWYYLTHWIWS